MVLFCSSATHWPLPSVVCGDIWPLVSTAGVQAFQAGPSVGLQFHPEVDAAIVDRWVRDGGRALADEGIDAAALLDQTTRLAPAAGQRAMALFDALLSA